MNFHVYATYPLLVYCWYIFHYIWRPISKIASSNIRYVSAVFPRVHKWISYGDIVLYYCDVLCCCLCTNTYDRLSVWNALSPVTFTGTLNKNSHADTRARTRTREHTHTKPYIVCRNKIKSWKNMLEPLQIRLTSISHSLFTNDQGHLGACFCSGVLMDQPYRPVVQLFFRGSSQWPLGSFL